MSFQSAFLHEIDGSGFVIGRLCPPGKRILPARASHAVDIGSLTSAPIAANLAHHPRPTRHVRRVRRLRGDGDPRGRRQDHEEHACRKSIHPRARPRVRRDARRGARHGRDARGEAGPDARRPRLRPAPHGDPRGDAGPRAVARGHQARARSRVRRALRRRRPPPLRLRRHHRRPRPTGHRSMLPR